MRVRARAVAVTAALATGLALAGCGATKALTLVVQTFTRDVTTLSCRAA